MTHLKLYPDFGEIKIAALEVKRNKCYYRLGDNMDLETAFIGLNEWFVSADIVGTTTFNPELPPKLPPKLISCSEALTKKRGVKRKCLSELEACANSPAQSTTKVLMVPFSDGGALKPNYLVGEKDNLQKHDNGCDQCDLPDHVRDASFVSSDAVTKSYIAKKSSELVGNLEGKISGSSLNQESQAHNVKGMSGSQVKKAKKAKKGSKGGSAGLDRFHAVTSGKLSDIMEDGVENFDDVNIIDELTPPELIDGSKLIPANLFKKAVVNEEDAAFDLVERVKVNEEDVAPLKSSELKVLESEKSSKRRDKSKQKSPLKEKQDSSNVREKKLPVASKQDFSSLEMLQSGDINKPEQTRSTPRMRHASKLRPQLQGSSVLPSKELLNEKMMEMASPKTVSVLMSDIKTNDPADQSPAYNEELKDVPVSTYVAEEMNVDSPKARKTKKTKTSKENGRTSQPAPPLMKPKKRSKGKQTSPAIDAPETPVTEQVADPADQSQMFHEELKDISAPPVSANVAADVDKPKANKRKTKKTLENERTSQAVSQTINSILVPAGTAQIGSGLLQPASCSKPEENIVLGTPKLKRSKSKQISSAADAHGIHVAEQVLYHEGLNDIDIPAFPVAATVAEETNVDKPKAAKKKTYKSKENERTSQAVSQLVKDNLVAAGTGMLDSERLQPAESSKAVENTDHSSVKVRKTSKRKQSSPAIDTSEIPVSERPVGGIFTNNSMSGNDQYKELGDSGNKQKKLGSDDQKAEQTLQSVYPEVDGELSSKPKKQKIVVEQAQDVIPNSYVSNAHDEEKVLCEKRQDGSPTPGAVIRNLEKQSTNKSKHEKRNQPTSVGSATSFIIAKGHDNEIIPPVDRQILSGVHEAEQSRMIDVEFLQSPQTDRHVLNGDIMGDKPKKTPQKKIPDSEKKLSSLTLKQQSAIETQKRVRDSAPANSSTNDILLGNDSASGKSRDDLSMSPQPVVEPKVVEQTASVDGLSDAKEGLSEEEQPDRAAEHGKGLSLQEGHDNGPYEVASPASKEKGKNLDLSSVDTKSKKETANVSDGCHLLKPITKRGGIKVSDTKPPVGENSSVAKRGVPRISGGLFEALSSDSSGNEFEGNRSKGKLVSLIPDNTNTEDDTSSDESEEHVGHVGTSRAGRKSAANTTESDILKDMDFPSIVRRSSLYKQIRATLPENEEDENESADYVSDSVSK